VSSIYRDRTEAFLGMLDGKNFGKLLVPVS
jgi:NADPH-dependent curcumin reductase CurA